MSPDDTKKKPAKRRLAVNFYRYYHGSRAKRDGSQCDHRNRVPAGEVESSVIELLHGLAASLETLAQAITQAWHNYVQSSKPMTDELALTNAGLRENQRQSEKLVESISSGNVGDALLEMLNDRANALKAERDRLQAQRRCLTEQLVPQADGFDAAALWTALCNAAAVADELTPHELQQLLRLVFAGIEWRSDGLGELSFYNLTEDDLPKTQMSASEGTDKFGLNV